MAERMRRCRGAMSLDRPSQLTLTHGLSVDSKEFVKCKRTTRRPPQLRAGLMGIAMGSPDDVEFVQRGYKSDGASLDRSHDSLRDMSRFESGISLDRDPARRRELYGQHRGRTFDEESSSPARSQDLGARSAKPRSKDPSVEEHSPEHSKKSVCNSDRKKSRADRESASSLQDTTSAHSSGGGGLFEKHFGRNKKQHKLEKSKRLSTSALYDKSPTEAFYNKTGSMRLSAIELFEKFCSEDFSSLYGPGSHYDEVFKEDAYSKDRRRESRSSPRMCSNLTHKSSRNIERLRSVADNNSITDITKERIFSPRKPNSLPLSANEIICNLAQLSLPIQINDLSTTDYNVEDRYEPCLGVIRKKRNSFKKDIMPNFKDRPFFEWCNLEFRAIDDDDSPTVSKQTAEPTPEDSTQNDSRSYSSEVFASNEDVSLYQDSGSKIGRGRLVHQRGIDKEEMTSSMKSNSTTIEEESFSLDKSLKSPADTWSVTERIEFYDEIPKRSARNEKAYSPPFFKYNETDRCSEKIQFFEQKIESSEKHFHKTLKSEISEEKDYFDESVELEYDYEADSITADKTFTSNDHLTTICSEQNFPDSHSTLVNQLVFRDDENDVKDEVVYENIEQDAQSVVEYSSETEEISGFCDVNEANIDKSNSLTSQGIWAAINAFEKIERCAERAKLLREQMKDPNNSLCSSQEQNEDINKITLELKLQDAVKTDPSGDDSQLSPVIPNIPPRLSMQKLKLINIESTIAMANESKISSSLDPKHPTGSKDAPDAESSDQTPKSKSKETKKTFFRLRKDKSDGFLTVPKKSKCFPL